MAATEDVEMTSDAIREEGKADDGGLISFEDGWRIVKNEGVQVVLRRLEEGKERMTATGKALNAEEISKLHGITYGMCTQPMPYNWSGKLYYAFVEELRSICEVQILAQLETEKKEKLLSGFIGEWEKHMKLTKCLQATMGYLDRFYVKRLALPSLNLAAVKAFHDFVYEPVKERISRAFLDEVQRDRANGLTEIEIATLRNVSGILLEMSQGNTDDYENDLEGLLLTETEGIMRRIAADWIAQYSCPQYLYKVKAQLAAESLRIDNYLHEDTREKLLKVCEMQLISVNLFKIINMPDSGCRWLLENDEDVILEIMFVLLRRVPNKLAPMALIFRKFLQEKGAEMLSDPQFENQWKNDLDNTLVVRLVNMYQRYRNMIKERFAEHNTFHRALKDAFEYFINLPLPMHDNAAGKETHRRIQSGEEITISELLSDYIDRRLRKPPSQMIPVSPLLQAQESFLSPRREALLEKHLVMTIDLFGYVNDKDIFSQFYQKHLAKRLILGRSSSSDAEQIVIGKLQQLCGNPFVSKFSGMLKDLLVAINLQKDFDAYCFENGNEADDFEFKVKVLTSGFWPSYKQESIDNLPLRCRESMARFQKFYETRTAHRRLTWIHQLGSMKMVCTFARTRKLQLIVNTFQGAILSLYDEEDPTFGMSLPEMVTKLDCSEKVLEKHLYSLANGRHKILRLSQSDGRFYVNTEFATKKRRLRIPLLAASKAKADSANRAHSLLKVSEERRYAVEAAIVRIMKSSKSLSYNDLSSRVLHALSNIFSPQSNTIRKRVDDLLGRGYLQTDPNNDSLLHYIT